jgi:hypothetical protein
MSVLQVTDVSYSEVQENEDVRICFVICYAFSGRYEKIKVCLLHHVVCVLLCNVIT